MLHAYTGPWFVRFGDSILGVRKFLLISVTIVDLFFVTNHKRRFIFNMSALLGIQGSKFTTEPIDRIYRFHVYSRGKFDLLEPEHQAKNINFQINGERQEQVVVRLWKNESGVYKGRYYYSTGMDREQASYLAREWINRLRKKMSFAREIDFKAIDEW